MVNRLVSGGISATTLKPRAESADSFTTIGGLHSTDPVGVIRYSSALGNDRERYLLIHHDPECVDPPRETSSSPQKIERYSLQPGLDWWAGDLRGVDGCYRFRAYHRGEFCTEVRLQQPGEHQVLPALAAVAIGIQLQFSPDIIRDRLEDFSGIPRGFESRGSFRGATLVDDEANGSGAVADTLRLAREVFGRRWLQAIYLPFVENPTSVAPEVTEFAEADHLIVVEPGLVWREWTRLFVARLRSSGISVVGCPRLDQAIRELDRCLKPGDVLVTLGAGEVGTIADAFLRRLSRDRHG